MDERGIYRGFSATVWREMPSYGFYFASYDVLSRSMGLHQIEDEDDAASAVVSGKILLAGGLAGIVSD
jgi:solute carrier family 25 (mitochondrial carnitine/acylcarnitine transporter), member 20/29